MKYIITLFLIQNLYAGIGVLSDSSKNTPTNPEISNIEFDIEVNIFAIISSGIDLSAHYYLSKNIAIRLTPAYFWRPNDEKYFSTNLGLKYIFFKKKSSKIYFVSEVGYFNWKFEHNNLERESRGSDLQIGVGFHWTPLLNKKIGTTLEFTYSFSESKTINFPDGYSYKDFKAKDRLIGKISYFF